LPFLIPQILAGSLWLPFPWDHNSRPSIAIRAIRQ
jgi:hypothetical protein